MEGISSVMSKTSISYFSRYFNEVFAIDEISDVRLQTAIRKYTTLVIHYAVSFSAYLFF